MQARARSTSPVLRRHCRVSPQRRVIGSRAFPLRPVCARGRTPDDLGAAAHPARGSPEGGSRIPSGFSRASSRGAQREGPDRSSLRRSRFGPVRGLGPMSSRPKAGDGRANRRRTASPLREDALLRIGDAACATARLRSLRGLCGTPLAGVSPRAERQRAGYVPQGDPKVALLQVPTEMGSLDKTRSGSTMTPPMGFGSFRREKPR